MSRIRCLPKPSLRRLRQQPPHPSLEPIRHSHPRHHHRNHLRQMSHHRRQRPPLPLERTLPRHHLERQTPQRIQIRPRPLSPHMPLHLLRSHVIRSPHHATLGRPCWLPLQSRSLPQPIRPAITPRVHRVSHPKIRQLDPRPIQRPQHIIWLQIPMNQPPSMRMSQPIQQSQQNPPQPPPIHSQGIHIQSPPQPLHRQIRSPAPQHPPRSRRRPSIHQPELMNPSDPRMLHARHGPRLIPKRRLKPLLQGPSIRDHLHRQRPPIPRMSRGPNLPHAATSDAVKKLEDPES